MRSLAVGTAGVGSAFAGIARRRSFFEHCALANHDAARPEAVVWLIRETRADAVAERRGSPVQRAHLDACFETGVWVALELLASGDWKGAGVLGPEAFPPQPFLAKLAKYGSPQGVLELDP